MRSEASAASAGVGPESGSSAESGSVGASASRRRRSTSVSRKATALTDPLALTCIRLVAEHLETAWSEPANRAAREGMMLAATLGGMAFANSSVALVHGMSRPIGAVFHVPHVSGDGVNRPVRVT